jgi:hypothetical protein
VALLAVAAAIIIVIDVATHPASLVIVAVLGLALIVVLRYAWRWP